MRWTRAHRYIQAVIHSQQKPHRFRPFFHDALAKTASWSRQTEPGGRQDTASSGRREPARSRRVANSVFPGSAATWLDTAGPGTGGGRAAHPPADKLPRWQIYLHAQLPAEVLWRGRADLEPTNFFQFMRSEGGTVGADASCSGAMAPKRSQNRPLRQLLTKTTPPLGHNIRFLALLGSPVKNGGGGHFDGRALPRTDWRARRPPAH